MKQMSKLILSILVLIATIGIVGAIPVEEWYKTYGGTKNDIVLDGQQTKDGGYIFAGWTLSYGAGKYDAWIVKTYPDGKKQWEKTFGGISYDSADAIQQTKDGGYIFAGTKKNSVWLVKIDVNGNKIWEKIVSTWEEGRTDITIYSVQQTYDDGYIIGGASPVYSAGGGHFNFVVKTDRNGKELWKYQEGSGSNVWFGKVIQTFDNNYIVIGANYEEETWTQSTWLQKLDNKGNILWSKLLKSGIAESIQRISNTGYILSGYTNEDSNIWIARVDIDGNELWNKKLGKGYGSHISLASDGGYVITGNGIIKTDYQGNIQWSINSGRIKDGSHFGQQTKDGGYILFGHTNLYGAGNYDALLIKLKDGISINALKNPGFETSSGSIPMYWNKVQTGKKAIFTYPEIGKTKSVAIKYAIRETGKVALWQQSGIVVSPNSQYKLSGYMKLQGVTGSTAKPRPGGASIRVSWYKSDGKLIKTDVINKKGTIGWKKYEAVFKAPSNAVKAIVGGDLFDSAGKVWFDDLSFVKI